MDDKGEIISSYDVDENLALQMWTKGFSPRLVVLNKVNDKKKYIRLSWLEDPDRTLSIKGKKRGSLLNYKLADLMPPLQRIVAEYAVYTSFKTYLWKFTVTLEKVLHAPAIIFNKKEMSLLPEDKRSRLWVADLTGDNKDEGFFRPFFPLAETERAALSEAGLPFVGDQCSVEDLFKTGVIRKLNGAYPMRWNRTVRIMAAAILLGFSFCEEDGSEFTDEVWRSGNFSKPLSFKFNDPRLGGMSRKFVGYARHIGILDQIKVWASLEAEKDLLNDGFARTRRIDFPPGILGAVDTVVTFFFRDDGMMGLACKPKVKRSSASGGGLYYAAPPQKSQEKQELVYTFPKDIYDQALLWDALGGTPDDYFTVGQLASAKIFEAWSENLRPFITYFTELL